MPEVKPMAPRRIGGTDIMYAQGMRAGPWLFFTGHMASDFAHGLAAEVAGKPGLPLGSPPRYRREGDFIIDRFGRLIAADGGALTFAWRAFVPWRSGLGCRWRTCW